MRRTIPYNYAYHGLIIEGNTLKQASIEGGYVTFGGTTPQYHFYIQDHQGNNRLVCDESGTIEQVNHYYPYGGLFGESTNDEVQRYKYSGKELDRMHGLNLYDYHARQYDAAAILFTSMDSKCENYYHISPYVYCMGNPIKLIDSDGKRPKAYEAALMAAYVYGDKNSTQLLNKLSSVEGGQWQLSKFPTSIQTNYNKFYQNGLQSVLFERTKNGVTEYAYVYAGTNSAEDWVEDFIQIAGIAPQYHTAIKNARTLSNELENNELTFVGHSLGGGEAIASSMATGRAAITFNPAAVSLLTKYTEGLEKKPDVVNYRAIGEKIGIGNIRIGGDVLNNLQEKVGLSLPGRTIGIPTGLKPTHSIDEFLHSNILDPL